MPLYDRGERTASCRNCDSLRLAPVEDWASENPRFAPVHSLARENLRVRLKRRLDLTDEETDSLIRDSGGYQVARMLLRERGLPEALLREKRYEHVLYEAGVLTMEDLERIRASRRIR